MSASTTAQAFSFFKASDGTPSIPLYLIPFDKEGRCMAPRTLEEVNLQACSGEYTDVYIYSHGWNNIFSEAVAHYTEFFSEYFGLRKTLGLGTRSYKPLLVGIIWPSTALVSKEDETPKFAGDVPDSIRAQTIENEKYAMTEIATELQAGKVGRFLELAGVDRPLTHEELVELAMVLLPVFQREGHDREGIPQAVTPEKLVKAWVESAEKTAVPLTGKPGTLPDEEVPFDATIARAAGIVDFLTPREIIRKATVFIMKDRAGTVGARGLGPVLTGLLRNSQADVHLTGHSFGAKVVLSALSLQRHPRKVKSVLLLQPAVNAFCFSPSIRENGGRPGAYRMALDQSEQPIFSTFSAQDSPLTKFFHLALRRDGDLGELRAAAGPPSKFAALGGFGPGGMEDGESKTIPMMHSPAKYDLSDPRIRLYALDGSGGMITGHGDVRNDFTAWALINLVSR
jgi:hypothetical protein